MGTMPCRSVFLATHPRACSTAFERVFMTRRDELQTFHEPFSDPWYYGPERLSERFQHDPAVREASGHSNTTFKDIVDRIADAQGKGKHIFIKEMAYYLFAPDARPTDIAPSLGGGQEADNPTLLPLGTLRRFHFAFLIRHPRRSIPSLYRCTVPPLRDVTGFTFFMPNEAGYEELVRLLNFLVASGLVDAQQLTVIDADDLLASPEPMLRKFCQRTGIDFKPGMLEWSQEDQEHASSEFAKWNGFHDDAIKSSSLKARKHVMTPPTVEEENQEWVDKYGADGQRAIRAAVDANVPHYEYLKQFCQKV